MALQGNPLLNVILQTFHSLKSLTTEDVISLIVNFPKNYEVWWQNLLREAPQHILIETTLIAFIIWLVFIRRTVDPKKSAGEGKLTQKEIDWLLETWQPEPLVPKLDEKQKFVLSQEKIVEDVQNDFITFRGMNKAVLNVSSFDFYGLSKDQGVKQAARDALDHYGCGSCGPRGFYGTIDQHLDFESAIAKFMGAQEAILYSDGASAVASAIPAFCKKGDLILVDEACSEPIMMGVNLSRSTVRYFRHNDMVHLESLLEAIAKEDRKLKRDTSQQRRFIIAEAVYRNIGDICPLKELLKIKEKYFYRLVLDETYSFGVLGQTGRGLTEHVGVKSEDIEVITLTLDTALGSVGGICVGSHGIVDHQRLSGAGYCFSASLAPFLAASAIAALKKLQNDSSLVAKLSNVSKKLYSGFAAIPELKIISDEITGIAQLTLRDKFASDLEEAVLLQKIADYCLQNGIAICLNKFALLHSKALRPSLMVCANAHWTDETIRKIVDTVAKGSKTVFKSK